MKGLVCRNRGAVYTQVTLALEEVAIAVESDGFSLLGHLVTYRNHAAVTVTLRPSWDTALITTPLMVPTGWVPIIIDLQAYVERFHPNRRADLQSQPVNWNATF